MPLLFSYGTLQDPRVQLATVGRGLEGRHDALPGFEVAQVAILDPAEVASTGLTHYQNAVGTGHADASVPGMAFEVTEAELATADAYERPARYARMAVVLASGTRAWVYVHVPPDDLEALRRGPRHPHEAESRTVSSLLWRRLDQPGHDAARLVVGDTGARLEGTAVFEERGRAWKLDYRVECDAAWRTRAAQVTGWCDTDDVTVVIAVDDDGRWRLDGHEVVAVRGCVDLDLSFTPATNVLPLRRLMPAMGARVPVRAAWLRLPECTLEPLDQTYERLTASRYRYHAPSVPFSAVLETNHAGMVTSYPPLWHAERAR